jgi:hypothetical protein
MCGVILLIADGVCWHNKSFWVAQNSGKFFTKSHFIIFLRKAELVDLDSCVITWLHVKYFILFLFYFPFLYVSILSLRLFSSNPDDFCTFLTRYLLKFWVALTSRFKTPNASAFQFIIISNFKVLGPGSVVSIVTAYGLGGPGIESRWARDIPHLSRPALSPTQPPVKWVPLKVRPGRDADTSPSSSAEVKNRVELYPYSPYRPLWPMKEWNLTTSKCKLLMWQRCWFHILK